MQNIQSLIPTQEVNCPPRLEAEAEPGTGSEKASADVAPVNSLQVSEQASASALDHTVSSLHYRVSAQRCFDLKANVIMLTY